jgi:8-oxo-dGTP pyrophosphatase MutT (NUDIX family)
MRYTWDGLPIAPDEPHGASIVVRRDDRGDRGDRADEYLILHRAHHGPAHEGDWAWTPPAGSRQPGEPVLAAALRELAEETGLRAGPADLRVIDLSGAWGLFALDVPAGTAIRLDAEHDRFEWLSLAVAVARCQPEPVAAGLRQAAAASAARLEFRPLAESDLPDLVAWRQAPHVARWFGEPLDLAAAERQYRPRIAGTSATRVHVALADGRACGFVQHYRVGDYPDYAIATGEPDAIGIDYAIGVEHLTGAGLGPRLVWQFVREVVLAAHPATALVMASPDAANQRSVRALEKAAFRHVREIAGDRGPSTELLCALDLRKFFGNEVGSG